MQKRLTPSFVMQRDSKPANTAYTVIAVLVAIAMVIAASGAGTATEQRSIGRLILDNGGNILAMIIAVLVLIPRTRIIGAMLAVVLMFISMYLNFTIDGIAFFARAIPYNTITIMLSSILIGHYADDLYYSDKCNDQ